MDWRNRIGLYGSYFLGMAGIGFILPFLPVYLSSHDFSPQAISVVWTLAALTSLIQFPVGLWSDRVKRRKPFLLAALAVLALATWLLPTDHSLLWLGLLAILFAENGPCRSLVESLAGAEATHLAPPTEVGSALGALRFWRPIGVLLVLLAGVLLVESIGIDAFLFPVAVLQTLAVAAVLLIHEDGPRGTEVRPSSDELAAPLQGKGLRVFVAAMVLFHLSAAPGGAFLGLFLLEDLKASPNRLPIAFGVMMAAWMLATFPVGRLADRIGRKPLLILGWGAMTVRLILVALARSPWQVLAVEALDGLAQGLFGVIAATWVTDRLGDPRRVGEAQVLVGSSLVFGSALGPLLASLLVDALGYRGLFLLLSAVSAVATFIVIALVPETLGRRPADSEMKPLTQNPNGVLSRIPIQCQPASESAS